MSGFIVAALDNNEEKILMTDNGLSHHGGRHSGVGVSRRHNPLGRLYRYGALHWVKNWWRDCHYILLVERHFHLLDVNWEFLLGDSMILHQSLLGTAPESLEAIDIDFSLLELVLMINMQVLLTAEHQGIIADPRIHTH